MATAWDIEPVNLYTIRQYIDAPSSHYATNEYDYYLQLKYIKFLSIIADAHDNRGVRQQAAELMKEYKNAKSAASSVARPIDATDAKLKLLFELQKKYLDNIKNNSYAQKKIENYNSAEIRHAHYSQMHKAVVDNVGLFRQMLFIRKELANANGYASWALMKTKGDVSKVLDWLNNLQKKYKSLANVEINVLCKEQNASAIECYNQKYFELQYHPILD